MKDPPDMEISRMLTAIMIVKLRLLHNLLALKPYLISELILTLAARREASVFNTITCHLSHSCYLSTVLTATLSVRLVCTFPVMCASVDSDIVTLPKPFWPQ